MKTPKKKCLMSKKEAVQPMSKPIPLFKEIKELIEQSRQHVALTVNSAMTMLYWQIGKRLNEEVLQNQRAEYGEQIVQSLSGQLSLSHLKEMIYLDDPLKRNFCIDRLASND